MLRPTVSRPVGQPVLVSNPYLGITTKFLLLSDGCGFLMWGALSDERTGLSFTIVAGPRQWSHLLSQIRHFPSRRLHGNSLYGFGSNRIEKTLFQQFLCCCMFIRCRGKLFIESLPDSGCLRRSSYHNTMKYCHCRRT
jgi:hypothetical protein